MSGVSTEWLADRARALGFDAVGVCDVVPSERAVRALERWLAVGMHADMSWMARPDRLERTCDPQRSLAGARCVLVVAQSYRPGPMSADMRRDPARGIVAAYASGPDYHDRLLQRLHALTADLAARAGAEVRAVRFVDTGPLLERDAAARAGLGFVGRNTMLIRPGLGSWSFLGALLLNLDLPRDPVATCAPGCGDCRRCLDACPTGALGAGYVLDARRCASYWTIEHRGPIPHALRPLLGNRVFGCDDCNVVCPYNAAAGRRAAATGEPAGPRTYDLSDLVGLDEAAFSERFAGTAVLRARRAGLVRNACVAMGNWGRPEAVEPLVRALGDESPLVRGHAAWGLGRIVDRRARRALASARGLERDAWVVEEIARALARDAGSSADTADASSACPSDGRAAKPD